jgi:hypothetical protein
MRGRTRESPGKMVIRRGVDCLPPSGFAVADVSSRLFSGERLTITRPSSSFPSFKLFNSASTCINRSTKTRFMVCNCCTSRDVIRDACATSSRGRENSEDVVGADMVSACQGSDQRRRGRRKGRLAGRSKGVSQGRFFAVVDDLAMF